MKELHYTHGANYLLYDELLELVKEPIKSHGFTIEVGDKVNRIGKKVRTMFAMQDGKYMQYEGMVKYGNGYLALFNVPTTDEQRIKLNGKEVYMRYALPMVFVAQQFYCFMTGNHKGMRDVVMDDLKLIKD